MVAVVVDEIGCTALHGVGKQGTTVCTCEWPGYCFSVFLCRCNMRDRNYWFGGNT